MIRLSRQLHSDSLLCSVSYGVLKSNGLCILNVLPTDPHSSLFASLSVLSTLHLLKNSLCAPNPCKLRCTLADTIVQMARERLYRELVYLLSPSNLACRLIAVAATADTVLATLHLVPIALRLATSGRFYARERTARPNSYMSNRIRPGGKQVTKNESRPCYHCRG